jgi:hypothetical protein
VSGVVRALLKQHDGGFVDTGGESRGIGLVDGLRSQHADPEETAAYRNSDPGFLETPRKARDKAPQRRVLELVMEPLMK